MESGWCRAAAAPARLPRYRAGGIRRARERSSRRDSGVETSRGRRGGKGGARSTHCPLQASGAVARPPGSDEVGWVALGRGSEVEIGADKEARKQIPEPVGDEAPVRCILG